MSILILILLMFKKSLLVIAYDTPPVFNLELLPTDENCKTDSDRPPIIFFNEPFNVILKYELAHQISNITCAYEHNPEAVYAVANSVQKCKDHKFNISFGKVTAIDNSWKCKITFNDNREKSCLLKVYIRNNGSLVINGKYVTLPVTRDLRSKWDASGVYNYTPGEILNIKKENNIINTHIYIMKDEEKLFETREPGDIQLVLNTKYYSGVMNMYMNLSRNDNSHHEILKLTMNPIDKPIDTSLMLQFDGMPLTPEREKKKITGKKYFYTYIYTFRRNLTVECKSTKRDNSNVTLWKGKPGGGYDSQGVRADNKIIMNLAKDMPEKEVHCYTYVINGAIREDHNVTFKYQNPVANSAFISGLPLNRTCNQLKKEMLYEFLDGENLKLEYSQYNDDKPISRDDDIKWVLQGEEFSGRDANFSLNDKHKGANITCKKSDGTLLYTVHLVLRPNDTYIDQSVIGLNTNSLKGNLSTNNVVEGETGKSFQLPHKEYIIGAATIFVVLMLFSTLCFVRSSYRKRKLKKATDVSYDNLSNSTQPPFPPNWDRIARSQVKVDDEYSVPYTRQTDDITYEEPTCTRVGADIYTEPKRKIKRDGDTYANDKAPSTCPQETYAEVIPKALRKVEDPYAEIGTNRDDYENVFKGEPYVNYNNSEYVEAAYADVNDLK